MPTVADQYRAAAEYVTGKIYALEADTVKLLYDAYADAYRQMRAALETIFDRLPAAGWNIQAIAQREALLRQIAAAMDALDPEAAQIILDALTNGYKAGLAGTGYVLDMSVFADALPQAAIPLLPTEAIRAQMLQPYLGQTWLERYQDNRLEFELRIRRALVQSQIRGEGMRDVQRRIRDELGIVTDRRLAANRQAHKRNFYRTQLIARTEIIRASNLGAQAIYQRNSDVLKGWEYLTAKDERVCPRCGPLDGRRFTFGNEPADGRAATDEILPPPIHPQCRCTTLPVLIDEDLEQRIVGERETFTQWAQRRGLTENVYGQAYDLRGKDAPKLARAG